MQKHFWEASKQPKRVRCISGSNFSIRSHIEIVYPAVERGGKGEVMLEKVRALYPFGCMLKWKCGGNRDCVANCCNTGRRDGSVEEPVRWTAAETTEVVSWRGSPNGESEKIRSSNTSVCSGDKLSAAQVDDCNTTRLIINPNASLLQNAN